MPVSVNKEQKRNNRRMAIHVGGIKTNAPIQDKLQLKEEKEEKKDPLTHHVQTGVSLTADELTATDENSEEFKKKRNLVLRLMKVQKNKAFMHLLGNLPNDVGRNEQNVVLNVAGKAVEIGKEAGGQAYDGADAALGLVSELATEVKMPGIMESMVGVVKTFTSIKEMAEKFMAGESDCTIFTFIQNVDNAIVAIKETEGFLATFMKSVPLVGDLLSIISDGMHLVRTICDVVQAHEKRGEVRDYAKFNGWDPDHGYGSNRDKRRDAAINYSANGQAVDPKYHSDDQYRMEWEQQMLRKKQLLSIRNDKDRQMTRAEREEFSKIVDTDRSMRSLITFEVLRKKNVQYRDAWKETIKTFESFLADVAGFINPIAGAVATGVTYVTGAADWIWKSARKLRNTDKKDQARRVFAGYLYNHMWNTKFDGHVSGDKFAYPLPQNPDQAGQYVHMQDQLAGIREQTEFYEMADNISFTENTLETNGLDYGEALRQKNSNGLIEVMADSFAQD